MPEFGLFRSLGVASVGGRAKGSVLVRDGRFERLLVARRHAILSYLSARWVSSHLRPIAAIADAYGECGMRVSPSPSVSQRDSVETLAKTLANTTRRARRPEHDSAISRLKEPEALHELVPRRWREQGMPGARCTRGLVCNKCDRKRTRAYRYRRNTPAFPAQWLYGLCRALPGDEFVLPPSLAN